MWCATLPGDDVTVELGVNLDEVWAVVESVRAALPLGSSPYISTRFRVLARLFSCFNSLMAVDSSLRKSSISFSYRSFRSIWSSRSPSLVSA
eukprot:1466014-Pleurochrysis_carterae.AAC.1